ncbi:MAG: diacylglycerol kinase family lipid kinase [Chloroflexi bacterium]|nr:diacylglycerol kinase family lipid kinase [Chloroflexota bacterium]
MRTCVIFNPMAQGEKARRFRRILDTLGTHGVLKPTSAAGDARTLAAAAVREGYETIVAAGGDGTLNEVLNGLGDEPEGFARARLGLLPLGTVNVFAKELRLPMALAKAWKTIERGHEIRIDLPEVEFTGDEPPRRRYFAQMAGAGLDARAIQLVDWELKKRIGQFAYILAAIKALRGPQARIRATHSSGAVEGELVLIGNGRYYGGKLPMFHEADPCDGLVDVCVFPKVTWSILPRYAWGFLSEKLFKPGGTHYFQTNALKLSSPSPVPMEVEGEVVGQLPATITVRRKILRVIVPPLNEP